MATATRKTRDVTCEFVASAAGSPLAGLMALDDGKARSLYALAEVPAEAGGRAFLLKKVEGGTDAAADGYRCEVTYGGLPQNCECRGHLRWGTACKHLTHVGRLVFNGQL